MSRLSELLKPAAKTLDSGRIPLCESMLGPEGTSSPEYLRDWPLLAEKCMTRATMIMAFCCEHGHSGMLAKCEPHGRDDGTQICGYCAFAGKRVPVALSLARRL